MNFLTRVLSFLSSEESEEEGEVVVGLGGLGSESEAEWEVLVGLGGLGSKSEAEDGGDGLKVVERLVSEAVGLAVKRRWRRRDTGADIPSTNERGVQGFWIKD